MAVLKIDTSTALELYTQQTQLDGDLFTLTFRWNRRNLSWYVDIANADGEMIVSGRRCIVESRLTGQFKHLDGIPPGEMTVYDTTLRQAPPDLQDFGTRAIILYFDDSEAFV